MAESEKPLATARGGAIQLYPGGRIGGLVAEGPVSRRDLIAMGYSASRYDKAAGELAGLTATQAQQKVDLSRELQKGSQNIGGAAGVGIEKSKAQKIKEMREGFTKALQEKATTLSAQDREFLSIAGFSEIEIHEELTRGWIASVSKK